MRQTSRLAVCTHGVGKVNGENANHGKRRRISNESLIWARYASSYGFVGLGVCGVSRAFDQHTWTPSASLAGMSNESLSGRIRSRRARKARKAYGSSSPQECSNRQESSRLIVVSVLQVDLAHPPPHPVTTTHPSASPPNHTHHLPNKSVIFPLHPIRQPITPPDLHSQSPDTTCANAVDESEAPRATTSRH